MLIYSYATLFKCCDLYPLFQLMWERFCCERAIYGEGKVMVNRKLIRPSLSGVREQTPSKQTDGQRKRVPPDQTSAEQYYYLKQMSNKTPMVVRLLDGEEIFGIIEWYDKDCIKVNRETRPNLLIPKHVIKYIYKEHEVRESGEAVLLDAAKSR
jgi:host factor-I protein